jgi:ferredoxin/flavodoxin---NADP+ reductase
LTALADSNIREVVMLARRSPRDSPFSVGEFVPLGHLSAVDVVVDNDDLEPRADDNVETKLKLDVAR